MEIVTAAVCFKEDGVIQESKIAIGASYIAECDDEIFFYCENESDYDKLWRDDHGEDFVVVGDDRVYEIPFMVVTQDDVSGAMDGLHLTSAQMRRVAAEMSDAFMREYFVTMREVINKLGYNNQNEE